jgi:hypothetical protein
MQGSNYRIYVSNKVSLGTCGLVKMHVKQFECPRGQTVKDHPFKWEQECLP